MEVLQAGAATSVQGGRAWRQAHLGVPLGGPADGYSHACANRLVGNAGDAGALEMTLLGARLLFHEAAEVALCGAPFEATIPMWRAVQVEAGETVTVRGTPLGARCYLAVRGGCRAAGAVVKGGRIARADGPAGERQAVVPVEFAAGEVTLRYTAGAAREDLFYTVTPEANRRGIRLEGAGPGMGPPREMITEGVNAGTIQVPPSGQPLILFYDQSTTGGYAKLGTIVRADLDRVGQLRPRDAVRLRWVPVEEALRLARAAV